MQGLIYKDIKLFIKGFDKKLIIITIAIIVFSFIRAGSYGSLFSTFMLAMTICIQNIMSFNNDEKADWEKYQRILPVSSICVVGSKYISVLFTLLLSILFSIVFWIISSVVFSSFDTAILEFSILSAVIIPIIWSSICLPLEYWFGFRSAQAMSFLFVMPIFLLIKYFEDGPGMSGLSTISKFNIITICIAVVVFFILSFTVSILGYSRRQYEKRK